MTSVPFLKEIANILLRPGDYDLPETCIVFPNKRARLYLSKYIGELTEKPVYAPKYLTISELMEQISGYFTADRLTLMFELYSAYSKVTGSAESFDSFYPYSETLLADFDEIDKYLINADDLFQNLVGLKTLDGKFNYLSEEQIAHIRRFWRTFSEDGITGGQSKFISLWDALPGIYHEFKNRLIVKNMAYEGMAYRFAIENPDSIPVTIGVKKFLFVGFNALNACEEKLFKSLKARDLAEFFWDYDSWYTNTDIHEAGFFIRKNLNDFPQTKITEHEHLTHEKQIYFVPVSSNSGQVAILPHIVEKLGIRPAEVLNTALVLADESLLMAALYSIPESISEVNVTMGYPLGGSAVYSLIDSLYELLKNARKATDGAMKWYYLDILAIMDNPILRYRYHEKSFKVRQTALDRHLVYLSLQDILPDQPDDLIFNAQIHGDCCKFLIEVITSVIRELPMGNDGKSHADPMQVELLFQVYTFLTRLQDVLNSQGYTPGPDVLFRLIRKLLKNMHIPFSGEPLAGLQVLGILETRILDFENVVVLSANEGILPRTAEKPSFIPYNLRAGFGMPTPEHHDAIYAYYFYRLIQRAKQVVLVYDSSSGGMRTGERSRFLHQLVYEMQLPVKEIQIEVSIRQIDIKPIIMPKSGEAESVLRKYLTGTGKVLSPSAINEYLNCPIRFYFHYIAGLPQPEDVAEEIDARMFGSIMHHALKLIYSGFGKIPVTGEKLEALVNDEKFLNDCLDKAFSEILTGEGTTDSYRHPEGYNLIVRQVIFLYIRQFIKAEIVSCPFTVISLEERYAVEIPVISGGRPVSLKVGGIIDRIDRQGNAIRILDYKTGAVKDKFSTVESLFETGDKLRNDAAFQVLLYSWIYDQLHPGDSIVPGLFFLRQSHSGDFSASIRMGKDVLKDFAIVKDSFEILLKKSLEGLFNFNVPFVQTINLKVCEYCAYKSICRR